MAYLTERLLKQELGSVITSASLNETVTEQPIVSSPPPHMSSLERCNFQIARQLKDEKTKLINGLCQFPITALWLLTEHEQNNGTVEQDEESLPESDLNGLLTDIKKHYVLLSQTSAVTAANSALHSEHQQALTDALMLFPFSFEALTTLVDLMVYAYKFRGLCYQAAPQHSNKPDVVIKRLEGGQRRSRVTQSAELFKTLTATANDESFLLLSSHDMQKHFIDIVYAEQHWLQLRQELALANAKLVLFIANQYKAGFLDFEDLVQEGQTGLLKAVDRFDYRLGFQFSTYAGYWIRQAISRCLSRCERVVRVPCGQVANINKVYRAKDHLLAQTGQEPSIQALADYTLLSYNEVNMILSISQTSMSLETYEGDDESSFSPIDFLEQQIFTPAFNTIAEADLERLLSEAIDTLNPREAQIICCHFGIDSDTEMTLQQIGADLNLTRERVRQIQVMALNKIKVNFGQQLLSFL